jgi:hypothetical protein
MDEKTDLCYLNNNQTVAFLPPFYLFIIASEERDESRNDEVVGLSFRPSDGISKDLTLRSFCYGLMRVE